VAGVPLSNTWLQQYNETMISLLRVTIFGFTLTLCAAASSGAEQQWGAITGRFVVKGEIPPSPTIDPGTDQVCCQAKPQDESLVVGEEGALANVVVYLQPPRRDPVAIHPDLAEQAKSELTITNKGCAFAPRVLLVQPGQPMTIANDDPTNHNVRAELGAESFNVLLKEKATNVVTLKKAQRLPMPISCNIHPFMRAWILVRDDPYMAVSDATGKFLIEKLPAGKHEFQLWHERAGYLAKAAYDGDTADRRGKITVEIPPNETVDLGTITLEAADLMLR
jgi:plastocyanin